jgi:homocysteine S-methyltransferase
MDRIARFRIPIVAGLWPFESVLNAEFMANEVPGVTVPEPLLQRMQRTKDDGAASQEGIEIAHELGSALRSMVQGLHVSAPSGRLSLALRTLDRFI